MSRIGERINQVRTKNGMSQKQLGKKLGVSEGFVNEVETGRKVINQNLIDKISKILGQEINDITMSFEEETFNEEKEVKVKAKVKENKEVNEVWNDAFSSVLKTIPVYKYNLSEVISTRQLPIIGNKVEGFASDKLFFIEIEDNDMIGFRIAKGDIAFAHAVGEAENNSICLVDYEAKRVVRQIKRLDGNKLLLINNNGTVKTETVDSKMLKVICKLIKVEIKL